LQVAVAVVVAEQPLQQVATAAQADTQAVLAVVVVLHTTLITAVLAVQVETQEYDCGYSDEIFSNQRTRLC
jgi:hypothetical protein